MAARSATTETKLVVMVAQAHAKLSMGTRARFGVHSAILSAATV
jgi:hypothetical protein